MIPDYLELTVEKGRRMWNCQFVLNTLEVAACNANVVKVMYVSRISFAVDNGIQVVLMFCVCLCVVVGRGSFST